MQISVGEQHLRFFFLLSFLSYFFQEFSFTINSTFMAHFSNFEGIIDGY